MLDICGKLLGGFCDFWDGFDFWLFLNQDFQDLRIFRIVMGSCGFGVF
jgi:hypothetical protein